MPERHSPVLKNLIVTPERASFEFGNRQILLKSSPPSEAYAAFKELHDKIAEEFLSRLNSAPSNSSVLSRVREFVGSWFGALRASQVKAGHAEFSTAQGGASHSPNSHAKDLQGFAEELFFDAQGMHVRWQTNFSDRVGGARSGSPSEATSLTFALDSQAAEQLRKCYHELAILGYEVPGFDAALSKNTTRLPESNWGTEAAKPKRQPAPMGTSPSVLPATNAVEAPAASHLTVNSGQRATTADPSNTHSAPKHPPVLPSGGQNHLVTMQLKPSLSDSPVRALTASVENPDSFEVLVAPELMLRALRAAASLPASSESQLTFLQCAKTEHGLRIVNVGLGQNGEREPKAWQHATVWWQQSGRQLADSTSAPTEAEPSTTPATISDRTYSCGESPVGGEPSR